MSKRVKITSEVYFKPEYIDLSDPVKREYILKSHIGTSFDDWLKKEFTWWERLWMNFKVWRKVKKEKRRERNYSNKR